MVNVEIDNMIDFFDYAVPLQEKGEFILSELAVSFVYVNEPSFAFDTGNDEAKDLLIGYRKLSTLLLVAFDYMSDLGAILKIARDLPRGGDDNA